MSKKARIRIMPDGEIRLPDEILTCARLELRRGFDSAGVESVTFLSEKSFYTLYGWWLEPLSALAATSRRECRKISRPRARENSGEKEPICSSST